MSEFELNEDRGEFEVFEDFVYNGGNNIIIIILKDSKRSKWSTNFKKKLKD